jgi:putative GTP pyrophosphokinase
MSAYANSSDSSPSSSNSDFELDRENISKQYDARRPIYEALKHEIMFILDDQIASQAIKIHTIEARVKELPSLLEKCARKTTNDPFGTFVDIAAARIVCLFRPDLERLKKLVTDNFDVVGIDDKIEQATDPLGYLSIHMICKIRSEYSGPRYDKIRDKPFEIQLRTLCMHCWAAVSHYVDYKGDWDVPNNLKMALNALGGLFYVADSEFEQFYAAQVASKAQAQKEVSEPPKASVEINLDTVVAYLKSKFPKRRVADFENNSLLVRELKLAGYSSILEVDKDINRAAKAFSVYEKEHPPSGGKFASLGAARMALALASPKFFEALKETLRYSDNDKLLDYRHLVEGNPS